MHRCGGCKSGLGEGTDVVAVGGGVRSISKNRPSHKIISLNLMPTGCYFFIPFQKTKSQMRQIKNRSSENYKLLLSI